MAATELAIIPPHDTLFVDSSAVKLILDVTMQQQRNDETERLINKLKCEKTELEILLEPHKKYQKLFEDTIKELKQRIENIRNIQCNLEEEKTNGINQLKAKILECQVHFNKAGTAAYIKEQEKELAQLGEQIKELEKNLSEGQVRLATLQSTLTKKKQENNEPSPQRNESDLVALIVQKIKTLSTSF